MSLFSRKTPQEREQARHKRVAGRTALQEPLVGPVPAALASLLVPGLGQGLSRQWQRGVLIFASLITAALIFWSRIAELGRRAEPGWPRVVRAFERHPGFFVLVVVILVLIWLVNILDAHKCARIRRRPVTGVFVLVLAVFFVLGWQIARIDVVKLVREAPNAVAPLSRVLWPWEAAFEYEEEALVAGARIRAGEGPAPERREEVPGEPYLRSEPNVGELATQDARNMPVPGTEITLTGRNFAPHTETIIWWRDTLGNEFRPRVRGQYLSVVTDAEGAFQVTMTMPYSLVPPSAGAETSIHTVEARQVSTVGAARPSQALRLTISRMLETIFMGMMATVFGIVFSIPVSFLAARNIMSGSRFTMALYYLTRTILNIVRSIEPLIWALIAVVWVGLGPFAGIVALTVHSIAALGKLYSEAIEGIDAGPIEAIQATGANRLQTIMFGVIPQMISPFISFSIYRWDINVRMSTVIGLVGGGGIGFLLVQYIRLLDYRSAGIAVWFIAVTVAALDYVSAEIRNRLM